MQERESTTANLIIGNFHELSMNFLQPLINISILGESVILRASLNCHSSFCAYDKKRELEILRLSLNYSGRGKRPVIQWGTGIRRQKINQPSSRVPVRGSQHPFSTRLSPAVLCEEADFLSKSRGICASESIAKAPPEAGGTRLRQVDPRARLSIAGVSEADATEPHRTALQSRVELVSSSRDGSSHRATRVSALGDLTKGRGPRRERAHWERVGRWRRRISSRGGSD